jgi:hypothetical protein
MKKTVILQWLSIVILIGCNYAMAQENRVFIYKKAHTEHQNPLSKNSCLIVFPNDDSKLYVLIEGTTVSELDGMPEGWVEVPGNTVVTELIRESPTKNSLGSVNSQNNSDAQMSSNSSYKEKKLGVKQKSWLCSNFRLNLGNIKANNGEDHIEISTYSWRLSKISSGDEINQEGLSTSSLDTDIKKGCVNGVCSVTIKKGEPKGHVTLIK